MIEVRIQQLHFYRAAYKNVCPSVRLSVCLSVCLSDKRMHCDKTKETYAHILIPHDIILVFRQEKWLVGNNPCI